ncbi:YHYH protein [Marinomonas arenicola]|uniref:YHYH protein n=1 Tax=Marinomonas arenicola TaxID=569601 RepID=A0ABU9G484_9GAMM
MVISPILLLMLTTQVNAHEGEHSDHKMTLGGFYENAAIKVDKELVSCTLSMGTKALCYRITVDVGANTDVDAGPWCPQNINDDSGQSGIWLEGGKVYDVDGKFIKNLATFYKDDQWQLFNPKTGKVRVTDSKQACLAAARPDVDPKYHNYCVQCLPSYVEKNTTLTYLIPAKPHLLKKPQKVSPDSGVGVAFNGVKIESSAPVDAILGAHTIAPFDDCGGHVNTHVGYHYHAITGCTEKAAQEHVEGDHDHDKLSQEVAIGYAMDGFKLYTHHNLDSTEAQNLDSCGGHFTKDAGYHYHVNEPGKNQILTCFNAEPGCVVEGDETSCTANRRPPPQDCKEGDASCIPGKRPLPPECENVDDVKACLDSHRPPGKK